MNPYRTSPKDPYGGPEPDRRTPKPVDLIRRAWPDVLVTRVERLDGTTSLTLVLNGEVGEIHYGTDMMQEDSIIMFGEEVRRLEAVVALRSAPKWAGRFRRLSRRAIRQT